MIAKVNDKLQIESIEVYYDPLSLFNSITKNGAVPVTFEDGEVPEDAPARARCPLGFDQLKV